MVSGNKGDELRDEFLAEAQEIIEALSRDLLLLDQSQKDGQNEPDLLNEIFRGVHTLKGIAGMFGYQRLGAVAHALEDLLDDLRLGRVDLSQEVLDVLFEGVENFQRLLGGDDALGTAEHEGLAASIERVQAPKMRSAPPPPAKTGGASSRDDRDYGDDAAPAAGALEDYDLDAGVLAVLTEYEEHRLRTNVERGVPLFRLHVRFKLTSIDSALEDLKARAKSVAEIVTYLPSMDGGSGDSIDLDVLLASSAPLEQLEQLFAEPGAKVVPVPKRAAPALPRMNSLAAGQPSMHAGPMIGPPTDAPTPGGGAARPVPAAPLAPKDMTADQLSLRSVSNTVRVDIRKLDHLMNVVGELAIVRGAVSRMLERLRARPDLRPFSLELHRINRGFERNLEELQDGILDVRMVPLGQVFDKLARVVRQLAREHEKDIRLVVNGADTEVDKLIVEELSDPLMHIIRNAIDHGVERPRERELSGKPRTGTLVLNAFQKGNHVLIEVQDDGAGMDPKKLLAAAVERALVPAELAHEMTQDEILNLIFLPRFSTRDEITDLSGRGVGMDVVKTNISRLGGVVDVQSELGTGTRFTITLPITLAIISSLVTEVAGRVFCVPLTSVQEALLLDPRAVRTVEGREVITLRGQTLPICRLVELFGVGNGPRNDKQYVVVSGLGGRRIGFVVDRLHGQQDIVIKPLGRSLEHVRGFAGATDVGDQKISLVLDTQALIDEVASVNEPAIRGVLA